MGGVFGVVSEKDCMKEGFYGVDYHSHVGTSYGGMAVWNARGPHYKIHELFNDSFRSKLEGFANGNSGRIVVGAISDTEEQPLVLKSHLGAYVLVGVGKVGNLRKLAGEHRRSGSHTLMANGKVNPLEIVASLIDEGSDFAEGIGIMQERVEGSYTMLIMTKEGIYASRDKHGRTPLALGRRGRDVAVASESCSFPNLKFKFERNLGPGEAVFIDRNGEVSQIKKPDEKNLEICSFLWVYYGFPASTYEGVNVEEARYRCGKMLAARERESGRYDIDVVAGIPDSGTGHAHGFANASGIPHERPFVKYTPTWPRSFMPQDQSVRDLVAKMKLIPIAELIRGRSLLFCEDSIVRGTQLKDTIQRLYDAGAKQVHMRPACPPLIYGCKFLNFSRSKSVLDLAGRRAIDEMGDDERNLWKYANPDSREHKKMVEKIRARLNLTSLRYQRLDDLVSAIGLPKEKLCTFCWDGRTKCGKR